MLRALAPGQPRALADLETVTEAEVAVQLLHLKWQEAEQQQAAVDSYLTGKFRLLQFFLLLGYGIMFLLCVVLICYMQHHRNAALKGDSIAARKLLLPAFEPLLWLLGATTGGYTVYLCAALSLRLYTTSMSELVVECFYAGRQFVFVLVLVLMLQKSVSLRALARAAVISFILASYTVPIAWYMTTHGTSDAFYIAISTARALLLLLYTFVLVRPPERASKRTLREYCLFAYVYYALMFAYNHCFHVGAIETAFAITYTDLLVSSLCPLFIWRVLKADTAHWRGLGRRAVGLQALFRLKNGSQQPFMSEHTSSRGLHVMIELHHKHIIDFAYLELQRKIGVGSSAVVLQGLLRSKVPVAVKVYTPALFDEETVTAFSQEAALGASLHHPNIVRFYGMCVSPPTIGLVSELCQGSLEDVMLASIQLRNQQPSTRQQMLLNVAYMLDCSRAVAYLHSFSPPFLHRDLKPANFLVDADNCVKLTDFGESRSLPKAAASCDPRRSATTGRTPLLGLAQVQMNGLSFVASPLSVSMSPSPTALPPTPKMTVCGTIDYMAPEIINGCSGRAFYGEAADVYSLAITLWDVLHPGCEKFPGLESSNPMRVLEKVAGGLRPELPSDDVALHPNLRAVIASAWQTDPNARPSAHQIVQTLEKLQEELMATFAMQLCDDLLAFGASRSVEKKTNSQFSGERMAQCMEEAGFVDNRGEASRLGNALMDASMLHHSKHSRAFENLSNAKYFFDEGSVCMCQALDIEDASSAESPPVLQDFVDGAYQVEEGLQPGSRSMAELGEWSRNKSSLMFSSTQRRSKVAMRPSGVACDCRKHGQGLGLGRRMKKQRHARHRLRNRVKVSGSEDSGVLATKLLSEEVSSEFEEFDSAVVDILVREDDFAET